MAVDGDWKITLSTPMGPQEADLSVTSSGDAFTGVIGGGVIEPRQVSGQVAGDTLAFSFDIQQPMPLTIEARLTVSGDAIGGNAKLGMFGDAKVTGRRA